MFFDANVPQGVDVIGSIGQNSQYIKHQNQSEKLHFGTHMFLLVIQYTLN